MASNLFDRLFEGFDLTTSPATNAGDPLSRHSNDNHTSFYDDVELLFAEKGDVKPDKESTLEESSKKLDTSIESLIEDNSLFTF